MPGIWRVVAPLPSPQALEAGFGPRVDDEQNDEWKRHEGDCAYRGDVLNGYRVARPESTPDDRRANKERPCRHAFYDPLKYPEVSPRHDESPIGWNVDNP
jgi:hypothetical protein